MDYGHYVTVRKINGEWFYCDDFNLGGIQPLSRVRVRTHVDACVYLLKKGVDPDNEPGNDRPAA